MRSKQHAVEYLDDYSRGKGGYDKDQSSLLHTNPTLNDLLRNGTVSTQAGGDFILLTNLISFRNVAWTTTDEIAETLFTGKRNLSRRLRSLKGLVEITHPKGKRNPNKQLRFNPSLVWKGNSYLQGIVSEALLSKDLDWQTGMYYLCHETGECRRAA